MSEVSFPRGGTSQAFKEQKRKVPTEKDLFQTRSSSVKPAAGKKRKLTRTAKEEKFKKKKKQQVAEQQYKPNVSHIDILKLNALTEGMLILGRVKQVCDYQLVISLPNGVHGAVPITNISDAYTRLLQRLSEGDLTAEEELCSLDEMFKVGDVVRCKVVGFNEGKKGKSNLKLTINPRDVNSAYTASCLKNSMVLTGCISSKEDHGYIVDLGIKGVNTFLTTKAAKKYLESHEDDVLRVGSCLHCILQTDDTMELMAGENRTVKIEIAPRKVFRAQVSDTMGVKMNTLLPGMIVTGSISKCSTEGITLKFLGYFGSIHKTHLEDSPTKLEKLEEVKACVLYVQPTTKSVALTQLTHFVTPDLAPKCPFGDLAIGDIIEEAIVWRLDKTRGVYFKLAKKIVGFCHNSNLSDTEVKDIDAAFERKSAHRCRILDFDYADNVVKITLKESILSQQFLKYGDVKPGMPIECTVRALHPGGISVKVTTNINAFVPLIHLADVPLHKPEKKFTEGDKLKCKVLTVDPAHSKLVLTHKKSLVNAKLPDILSYDQCKKGMQCQGFVAKVQDNGILVVFFDNVKGWVPLSELSTEKIELPEKVFYRGQVVKCQVKSCKPEDEKLILSLKIAGKKEFGTKEVAAPDDYRVGGMCECRVTKKTEKGLDVVVLPSKTPAFLPRVHLSDQLSNCELLMEMYREGDTIKDTMYLSKSTAIILTRKPLLIKAAKENMLIEDFAHLKTGLVLTGVMKKVMPYGIFMDMLHGIIGLVPSKFIFDRRIPDPTNLFKVGQTLSAKVTEVDVEKQRFLLSLRASDCYQGSAEAGLNLLENYLLEYSQIIKDLRHRKGAKQKLGAYKIGQVALVTISEVNDHGALCELPNGVKGFCTQDNMIEVHCKAGDTMEGAVLYIDPKAICVELSLNPELVKAVKHMKDNKFSQVKVGQVIKSECYLVKEEFILVSLKGHASGKMAYLPAKLHLNDVFQKNQFVVGQINNTVIKRVRDDGVVIANLQIHEDEVTADPKDLMTVTQSKKAWEKIKLGAVTSAVVHTVHECQLNIRIGTVPGRVFLTEISDGIENGEEPLSHYKEGDEVKVKVIGFRESNSHNYLPISHPNLQSYLPECSLKPSKVSIEGMQKGESIGDQSYQPGDHVNAFVTGYNNHQIHMSVNPLLRGRVYSLNASTDVSVLNKIPEHFTTGKGYQATVLGIDKAKGSLELSLIGPIPKIKAGAVIQGFIFGLNNGKGLVVRLAKDNKGLVPLTEIADEYTDSPVDMYKEKQFVQCTVLKCNTEGKHHHLLSMRTSRFKQKKGAKSSVTDPVIPNLNKLKTGQIVRGFVINCNKKGVFVSLSSSIHGRVDFSCVSEYFIQDPEVVFYPGKLVTVKIISLDRKAEKVDLSLLEKDTGIPETIPNELKANKRLDEHERAKRSEKTHKEKTHTPEKSKRKSTGESPEQPKPKKTRKSSITQEEVDSGVEVSRESEEETDNKIRSAKKSAPAPVARLSVSSDFLWDDTFSLPQSAKATDSDNDSEDGEENSTNVKKSKKEKKESLKEEEKRLYQTEQKMLESNQMPQTATDFDRLVLQSPDSSLIWLRYMAFHLETTEIEKARAVAERALKTISFREEQEKLNVWVAYMNLENMYGTESTLKEVFDRAVKHNEPLDVYYQLIKIYDNSDKYELAESLYQTMVRRYSVNKDVWIHFGSFYFKHGKADSAHKLMQRSLKSLEARNHIEVIAKFAQMEFKFGEPERGKTMFENILSNYPKRTDLWSIYIDMLVKINDTDPARQIFERIINLSLSPKKMKFFFKKYLEFEEKYGSEESIQHVKQKAMEYVESKTTLETS